jgi:hypothetical protein
MHCRFGRGRVLPSFARYNPQRRSCEKSIAKLTLSCLGSLNGGFVVSRRPFPFLALFRHAVLGRGGPSSGVKQTSQLRPPTSAFDPHRKLARGMQTSVPRVARPFLICSSTATVLPSSGERHEAAGFNRACRRSGRMAAHRRCPAVPTRAADRNARAAPARRFRRAGKPRGFPANPRSIWLDDRSPPDRYAVAHWQCRACSGSDR